MSMRHLFGVVIVLLLTTAATKICCQIYMNQDMPEQQLDTLHFYLIGDWGGLPIYPYFTFMERSVAKQLAIMAQTVKPSAVFALGDNFYFDGVSSVEDVRFQETFEQIFVDDELPYPWHPIAGNHDWRGNVTAQILYSNVSSRWQYPDYFYTVHFKVGDTCAAFIMIDTTLLDPKHSSSDYVPWVEQQLKKWSHCGHLFVAGHHPVWSAGLHGPTSYMLSDLDPLFVRYNISAYFSGHDHDLQHILVNNTNYFVTGAANFYYYTFANTDKVPPNSIKYNFTSYDIFHGGFTSLSLSPTTATVQFIHASAGHPVLYEVDISVRNL